MSPKLIREELFDSSEAFLNRLSPRHPGWEGQPQAWAFRGHADASWALIPSAFATDARAVHWGRAADRRLSSLGKLLVWGNDDGLGVHGNSG